MNELVNRMMQSGVSLPEVLGLIGVLFLVVTLLFFVTTSMATAGRHHQRRMARVQQRPIQTLEKASKVSVRRTTAHSSIAIFDQLIRIFLPNAAKLRARLDRTGHKISIGQYLVASFVVLAVVSPAVAFALSVPILAALLVGVAAGAALPYLTVLFLGARRVRKFVDFFPEAIDLIVRGLKSGLPVGESIKAVGREIADPVGTEFRLISDSLKFGMTLGDSLAAVLPRVDSPEYRFFLISLAIQQETGGNLAETLENLSHVIRRRRQMRLKIKAYSSEAKASAYIIGALPFLMFGIILTLNYEYGSQLFTDPRGTVGIVIGLVSYVIGIGVMWKMIKFEI